MRKQNNRRSKIYYRIDGALLCAEQAAPVRAGRENQRRETERREREKVHAHRRNILHAKSEPDPEAIRIIASEFATYGSGDRSGGSVREQLSILLFKAIQYGAFRSSKWIRVQGYLEQNPTFDQFTVWAAQSTRLDFFKNDVFDGCPIIAQMLEDEATALGGDYKPVDTTGWWTAKEAAENKGVHPATIRNAGERGEITRAEVRGRGRDRWRFDPASVRRWQPQRADSGDPDTETIAQRMAKERLRAFKKSLDKQD